MKKIDYIILFILSLLIILIPFVFFIYFATPDDPRYIYLLCGSYTGTPCSEVVFMGSIFGSFTAFLYSINDSIEWFGIQYYIYSLFAFAAISWNCLDNNLNKLSKYSLLSLTFLIHVYLTFTPQSTMLSTELGFASFLMMLNANKSKWKYTVSIILFFIGIQMRFDGVFIPYMIGCPLFLKNLSFKNFSWIKDKIYLVILLVVAGVCLFANKSSYESEDWTRFKSYNNARGFLADNPFLADYEDSIKDEEDLLAYRLFYKYRIFDQNILTQKKIDNYKEHFSDSVYSIINKNLSSYISGYKENGGFLVFLILLVGLFVLIKNKNWQNVILFSLITILFAIANLYMMTTGPMKERVILFTYITFIFSTSALCLKNRLFQLGSILLFTIYFGYCYFKKDYTIACDSRIERKLVCETEKMLSTCKDDKVLLPVPTELTPELFSTSKSIIGKKGIIQGWMHIYPKADLSYQPFTSLVDGIPVLIRKNSMEQITIIQRLIQLHYHIDSTIKLCDESENYFLLKLVSK